MTRADFHTVFMEAINKWKSLVPKDTGHLSLNAIKGQWINDRHFRIYVDRNVIENQPNIEGKVAGYYYPKLINDKPNYKTYGWVENTAMEVARYIARRLKGEIK